MLMKITENNGLETYVFEPRVPVAFNMMKFFKDNIGLDVQSMTDYEPMYSGVNIDVQKNLEREIFYKEEFKKFGSKQPKLYIVK